METDSTTAAKLAGLNISERTEPGITRLKIESPPNEEGGVTIISFEYKLPNGEPVIDEQRIS
ncbi:MAG TPA: hypothetical protein QF621_01815, partial [Candidatus Thalassarchaeaceae archaeon]|nr:hypothetical protein [Candidatus Thalassarchaeaceae archaeon]